jgi:hypothetical protein
MSGNVSKTSRSRPKLNWYQLYFVLVAFYVGTVLVSLILNNHNNRLFMFAVETNSLWLEELTKYNKLRSLAAAVNAPGNEVFDSHDVESEEARLISALREFSTTWSDYSKNLDSLKESNLISHDEHVMLRANFVEIESTMSQMVEEARRVFSLFRERDEKNAAARMATMDRRFAELSSAIGTLTDSTAEHSADSHFITANALSRKQAPRVLSYRPWASIGCRSKCLWS